MSDKTKNARITKAQAKNALLRSGYLLEYRLETILIENGYYVEANSAYPDPGSGKSREIDLYALTGQNFSRDYDMLFNALIIECIKNPQPIAFLTKEPQFAEMYLGSLKLAGLPVKIYLGGKEQVWESLRDYIHMEKFHHYCKGRVATQFCSFTKKKSKKNEWMAQHEGVHFDVFKKLCHAVDFYVDEHFGSWLLQDGEPVNIEIYYPIVVVQGELIDVRTAEQSLSLIKTDHIRYYRTAIHTGEATNYHIDVVTERYFSDYLRLIEDEIELIIKRMKRRKKKVRQSIDKIVKKAKRLRSHEKIRETMDF